jgi:maltodextrin utilization protein YvdJ
MNLTSLFTGGIDKVIDSIGNAFDELFTSDDERNKAKIKLMQIRQDAHIESFKLANAYEQSIDKRWKSDNEHFITRLVRPAIVIFLFVLFGAVVISDGNIGQFKINPAYIPVLQTLLVTVTVAYFGSRGAEKISKTLKGKNDV